MSASHRAFCVSSCVIPPPPMPGAPIGVSIPMAAEPTGVAPNAPAPIPTGVASPLANLSDATGVASHRDRFLVVGVSSAAAPECTGVAPQPPAPPLLLVAGVAPPPSSHRFRFLVDGVALSHRLALQPHSRSASVCTTLADVKHQSSWHGAKPSCPIFATIRLHCVVWFVRHAC